MQQKINEYFNKLTSEKFFKYDDEKIMGRAKDVICDLKEQVKYIKDPKNKIDKEECKYLVKEANSLIKEIKKKYKNKDDVIKIEVHPMSGFYCLAEKEDLYDELNDYITS